MLLFNDRRLDELFDKKKRDITAEIYSYDPEYILNLNQTEFTNYLYQKHSIVPLSAQEEQIGISKLEDIDVDVSTDRSRFITDRSRPIYVKGTRITVTIPFEGDTTLLSYQPSTSLWSPPEAQTKGNEILLTLESLNESPDQIKSRCDGAIADIKQYFEWIRTDIEKYQRNLEAHIQSEINSRMEKIKKDKGLIERLGLPLIRRDEAQLVIKPPEIRRRIPFTPPSKIIAAPEPAIDLDEFEHILNIINRMILVMERSPKTFSKLEEESLRDFILVILNEYYEGQATGETFNAEGKTDILIRINNKNVFIAECKFWHGKAEFLRAIDQLLGYLSWRDTKTALIIFNKNRDFTNVINTIKETVKAHPNYKLSHREYSDTQFSYVFHQKGDKSRDIYIAICAFDIPQ